MDKYIRFDWAAKRMLRDKANFGVLEGLMTVLLEEEVKIVEILESEGNQNAEDDKFNRVDVKAKNSKGEIILVEIQQTRELYYLQRILYGVAKTISEHIKLGKRYNEVKKVYSISIVYFDLGKGADYLYHGQNQLVGVHTHDLLQINTRDKDTIKMVAPKDIFPEYYIIRVNEFNKVATTPLEEWIEYLKNGEIKDDTTTPGLAEAKERLQYLHMSDADRRAYDRHLDNIMVQNDILETKMIEGMEKGLEKGLEKGMAEGMEKGMAEGMEKGMAEGMEKGRAEGMEKGRAEGRAEVAKRLLALGTDISIICQATGMSEEEISQL